MQSITSLIVKLENDFSHFQFVVGDTFYWDGTSQTVWYDPHDPQAQQLVLHEVSHGILKHHTYQKDIELITMERQAWAKAQHLASYYHVSIGDAVIQDTLDTYRTWLHARSTCPACANTGLQTAPSSYHCLACNQKWQVNDAKNCRLIRRRINKKSS